MDRWRMRSTRLMDEFMILSAPRFETVTTATALPRLYLDNNAETTECIPSVRCHQGIIEACGSAIGNSSSSHTEGRKARGILGHARESLMAECNAPQLIFTSGATESNHLAIAAGMNAVVGSSPGSYRIVTTPFEHPSVTRVAAEYDPLYVKLLPGGEVDIKHLETLCSEPDVGMVSIILAHNELGIVQSIQEIRAAIERARLNREKNAGRRGLPLYHIDATQLLGKAKFDFRASGADMASWSAHKFHGPGGVGGLFVTEKPENVLAPFPICCAASGPKSGGQEMGFRAGTENPVGAACAAVALQYCNSVGSGPTKMWEKTRKAANDLANALRQTEFPHRASLVVNAYPDALTSVPGSMRLCNTVHVSVTGSGAPPGHEIAEKLDSRWGIAVSTGSACSKSAPSKALAAAGLSGDRIAGALRISLSPLHPLTDDDIVRVATAIAACSKKDSPNA